VNRFGSGSEVNTCRSVGYKISYSYSYSIQQAVGVLVLVIESGEKETINVTDYTAKSFFRDHCRR
jgi:hypothetical protein